MAYADGDPQTKKQQASSVALSKCGMAAAANLIGDRWTLLIIREALYGVTRFDEMQAELKVPRTVLSGRLKKLCNAGVLKLRPYKEPGQRARNQYVLTKRGVDLALPMMALMQWGDAHCRDGSSAAEITDRQTGAVCHVGLVREDGVAVDTRAVQFQVLDKAAS
ncbi:MAG: putative transcriptional regulator [Hyphococcus sp.]|nr:MAG: putative transcriptional regulator [Marinicaulis sp.]